MTRRRATNAIRATCVATLLLVLAAPAVSQSPTPGVEPSPSIGPVSPSPIPNDQWGPLAVVHGSGGPDAGVGPGRLVIGDRCVYLRGSDPQGSDARSGTTLIWRDGDTTWNPGAHQIVYHDQELGDIRLSSGDLLMLGGYGLGTPDRPENLAIPIGLWVSEPDASCPADRWVVGQVDPRELVAQQAPFCPWPSTPELASSSPSPSVAPSPGTVADPSPSTTAAGPSPGPSATPIPTLQRPASDARAAARALRAYYRDLHLGHHKLAWRRLAPESRAAYGSYAAFVAAHRRDKVERIWPGGRYRDEICGWIAKSPFADVELWRSKLFSVADGPDANALVDRWVVAPDAAGRWLLRQVR